MATVELKRLVGKFAEPTTGKVRTVGWDMDQLFLNGRQIATINRVPGAPIGLFTDVLLTPSDRQAVEAEVAKARGGVKPAKIGSPIELPYELLDDEDSEVEDDTEFDEVDGE
jgi:hypothetical protein